MWRLLPAALALAVLFQPALLADEIDDFIRREMATRAIPGLSLAVVRNDQVIKLAGYGFAELAEKREVTPDTPFQLASVTKSFVAAAMVHRARAQGISLDDPVGRWAEVPAVWRSITLRQLLNQTSGLPDYLAAAPVSSARSSAGPLARIVDLPLRFPPGERYDYSNSNYVLAGIALERFSGKSYDEVLRDDFFRRLGMTRTRRRDPRDSTLAVGYAADGRGFRAVPALDPGLWDHGDGGLVSTAADLARWAVASHRGAVLSQPELAEVRAVPSPRDGSVTTYALGVIVNNLPQLTIVGHSGSRPGAISNLTTWVTADATWTVGVLGNIQLPGQPAFEIAEGVVQKLMR